MIHKILVDKDSDQVHIFAGKIMVWATIRNCMQTDRLGQLFNE